MTGIIFEPFDAPVQVANVCGIIGPLRGFIRDVDDVGIVGRIGPLTGLIPPGMAEMRGVIAPLRGVLSDSAGDGIIGVIPPPTGYMSAVVVAPDVNVLNGALAGLGAEMVCQLSQNADIYGEIRLTGVMTDLGGPMVIGRIGGLTGQLLTETDYAGGITILQDPGFMLLRGDGQRVRIASGLQFGDAPLNDLINGLVERLRVSDAPRTMLHAINLLHDTTDFTDAIAVVWKLLLAESLGLADAAAPSKVAIETVLDGLRMLAGPSSTLGCRNLVAQTLALHDAIAVLAKEQLTDAAALSDALATSLRAREALVDGLLAGDLASGSALARAVLDDSMAIGDTPATVLQALNTVQEHIGFSLTIRIGDDVYVAWVCNTETRAQWQYTHWPFNSMCEFEGVYYGAQDDGIYDLSGDTDAGEDIKARIRLGLSDMGIRREKRMPSLYLSYTATDCLVLKAIVAEIDGTRSEYWYRLVPRGGGELREGRIKLGRGLKAVLYDFIIENVNGADFALDALEFFPLVLDRRVKGRDE